MKCSTEANFLQSAITTWRTREHAGWGVGGGSATDMTYSTFLTWCVVKQATLIFVCKITRRRPCESIPHLPVV